MLLNVSITHIQPRIYKFSLTIRFFIDGCINKYVCISVLHVLTLSGRFRGGFGGVGHDRALTFRDRPRYFEPPQYISVANVIQTQQYVPIST